MTSRARPRHRVMSAATARQSNRAPVPPRRTSERVSSTIASEASASSAASGGRRSPSTRTTVQSSPAKRPRSASIAAESGSPWSWITPTPATAAVSTISSAGAAPKTPTRAREGAPSRIRRASTGLTLRGLSAKTTPAYLPPSSSAWAASSGRVRPQNLISGATPHPGHTGQRPNGVGGHGRRRETGPYEDRVGSAASCLLDVAAIGHAALGHGDAIAWDERNEPLAGELVDAQRLEVPVVDADQGTRDRERASELGRIPRLEEDVQSGILGRIG